MSCAESRTWRSSLRACSLLKANRSSGTGQGNQKPPSRWRRSRLKRKPLSSARRLAPDATEAEAAIAASAPVASEAEARRAARADEFSSGPEAETAHGPEAEAVDAPLTPPVILSLDDDQTRSLLYIASDAVTAGDVSVPETHAIAGPTDDAAVPAESPAAVALDPQQERSQDHINVAAEVPADKDEAASAAVAVEEASTAPRVEAARAVPVVETASASAATEAAVPVVPLTRNGQEPAQVASLRRRKRERCRNKVPSARERSARGAYCSADANA
jgi:hypothetical protein